MSVYTNEQQADAAVIATLLGEIKRLRRQTNMGQLIVANDGAIYEAEHVRRLSDEEIAERKQHLTDELNQLNGATQVSVDGQAAETPAPVDTTVTEVAAAPAEQVTPVAQPAPVDAPAAPAAPAVNDVTAAPTAPQPPVLS